MKSEYPTIIQSLIMKKSCQKFRLQALLESLYQRDYLILVSGAQKGKYYFQVCQKIYPTKASLKKASPKRPTELIIPIETVDKSMPNDLIETFKNICLKY